LNGSPENVKFHSKNDLNIIKKILHAISEPPWAALMNVEEFHAICVETPHQDHTFSIKALSALR